MVLAAFLAASVLSGCRERVCDEGEYPVMLKGDRSGQPAACFENGESPTGPYTTFPNGQTPKYVTTPR